ncbi:hypothetical protein GOP47_0014621 [Adiantum capillus-veneris]|uniref:Small ribosomal subunit protein mS35 mitochondrial conserved domain-containing protein n=1 Tax=Adiantum capillus-veneris TaxID=13818 RepID=A0A9D4UN04_ADICA|nr:hypothetical protein GOP47_0014621 [Adiantum capillus-veneris]
MQYASRGRGGSRGRGRGRGGASKRDDSEDDDDDDDSEDDDDEDEEFQEEPDTPGYEFDYETWNLLHQGKKEGQISRKEPLPMYKAREMVDYHMMKKRIDGLKVITDPKMEYDLRKQFHEGMVDFFKKLQGAYDEIEARVQEKKKLEDTKEVLQVTEGDTKREDSENLSSGEGASDKVEATTVELSENVAAINKVETAAVEESKDVAAIDEVETTVVEESKDVGASMLNAGQEASQEDGSAEERDLSVINTAVSEVIKDVMSTPEVTTLALVKDMAVETKVEDDDGVNVFDYDKWVAYREQQVAKRYAEEEEKKHATLRWKIQLVLGPGDVVHPANRKASVSVNVGELCLSKYAKQRLVALVGKRYKAPKDELTIVSERFPHRYENQKDVLRTLLALIEEAKKADQFVYDARLGYLKSKNAELKKAATSVAAI